MFNKKLPFEKFEPARHVIDRNLKELNDLRHDIVEREKGGKNRLRDRDFQTTDMKRDDLSRFNLSVDTENITEGTPETLSELSNLTNSDACISIDQIGQLLFNSDVSAEFSSSFDRTQIFKMHLATWLNSIRNECSHCLNSECGQRDDSFPYDGVLKRKEEVEAEKA